MTLVGDPLELRFKMTVGTAQVGGTYSGPRPFQGEAPSAHSRNRAAVTPLLRSAGHNR